MIPKKFRLPAASFPKRGGVALRTRLFVVKQQENRLGYNRFGVIVSVAQEPKAAGRHLIKRRIMGAAEKLPPRGIDYLFIASAPAIQFTKNNIQATFKELF